MTTNIEKLLVLQERDRKIAQLEKESKDVPARKEQIKERVFKQKQELERWQEKLKSTLAAAKEVELEVQVRKGKIEKLRQQQVQVKSNDEYRAIEREVGELEREIGGFEDRELEFLEKVDEFKEEIRRKKEVLQGDEERISTDIANLDKRLAMIEDHKTKLLSDRESLCSEIDSDWLSRYERAFRHKRDFGLVPIDKGVCGGCFMKLPAHHAHDAKKALAMTICDYCGRMLYWRP